MNVLGLTNVLGAVDPAVSDAFSDGVGDIQSFLTGTVAIAVFGFAVAVIAIVFGIRWLKKTTRG